MNYPYEPKEEALWSISTLATCTVVAILSELHDPPLFLVLMLSLWGGFSLWQWMRRI